jgi:hypothetical protein
MARRPLWQCIGRFALLSGRHLKDIRGQENRLVFAEVSEAMRN